MSNSGTQQWKLNLLDHGFHVLHEPSETDIIIINKFLHGIHPREDS